MGPHLLWAGVVLVLGGLAFRAVRMKWRDRETFAGGLRVVAEGVDSLRRDLERQEREQVATVNEHHNRIIRAEGRLCELEPVVRAISAVPKGVPPVRRV
jgi:hypothetical protein